MFIPTTNPARVAVRRPIEALQRVAARIWPPKADDDFPSPRSPEDASDLPTEAVPSQPAATSSGVSNAADGPGGGQSLAQIGKSLKLKGEIMGNEDLYIDGEVEGTVELKGNSLTVGPNGNVHADVSAHSITILGRLQGNVKVGERTEIRKTGSFEGELLTAQIVSEDGAVFRGSIDIVKLGQNVANTPAADGPARTVRKQKGPGTPRIVATTPNLGASTAPKP